MDAKSIDTEEKLKYPKSVFFIIGNEFCERFSFYGMRTVLTLYLRNYLNYNDNTSTAIYHVFTMFAYFFPVFGAILADSLLGKFRTIFYLSIVYAIGQILLALTAAPPIGLPSREFSLVGLLLIALGTGGIKPCVTAFGGDQFVLPQQERYLSTYFSLFYFSINFGSLISSFLTPILRSDVECFGQKTCYSLAFFVPAVLMTVSIVIFIVGRPLYKVVKPTGNVVLVVSKCISPGMSNWYATEQGHVQLFASLLEIEQHCKTRQVGINCASIVGCWIVGEAFSVLAHAIYQKVKSKTKREHWLDYADDEYDRSLINDIKAALQVMKLFIPIPIFWALFDQQASRWTIQASRMDGEIGSYLLQPDQMQVINPLLVLAFIPIFEAFFYPLLAKIGLRTPLKKLTIGGILAALSFVLSALVEIQLEKTYPVLPSEGVAQLRVFNTLNCPVDMKIGDESFTLREMDMWAKLNIETDERSFDYTAHSCKGNFTNVISVSGGVATSWAMGPDGLSYIYIDSIEKAKTGNPLVRGLLFVNESSSPVELSLRKGDNKVVTFTLNAGIHDTSLEDIKPNSYDIWIGDQKAKSDVKLKLGGVYTVVGSVSPGEKNVDIVTVTEPNSMHILWQIPQYILITFGEVMFSVTGLEFAFTQAPTSMKSLLQASWLLTVAFGNLIVVIIAEGSWFSRQVYEFFLFAGLMFVDMIIFAVMAKFYKYVEVSEDETITEEINMDAKNGIDNKSYKDN